MRASSVLMTGTPALCICLMAGVRFEDDSGDTMYASYFLPIIVCAMVSCCVGSASELAAWTSRRLLEQVRGLTEHYLFVGLISGGGSALL